MLQHREVSTWQLQRVDAQHRAGDPPRPAVVEQLVLSCVQKRRGPLRRALKRVRRAEHRLRLGTQPPGQAFGKLWVDASVELGDGAVARPPAAVLGIDWRAYPRHAPEGGPFAGGGNPAIAGHRYTSSFTGTRKATSAMTAEAIE